jgi:hypothetical protein
VRAVLCGSCVEIVRWCVANDYEQQEEPHTEKERMRALKILPA